MQNKPTQGINALSALLMLMLKPEKCTGYDLSKVLNITRLRAVSHQQVYRELNKLADLGYTDCTKKTQEGKPDKKLYDVCPYGLNVLDSILEREEPALGNLNTMSPIMYLADKERYFIEEIEMLEREIEQLNESLSNIVKESVSLHPLMELNLESQIIMRSAELDVAKMHLSKLKAKDVNLLKTSAA